MGLFDDLREDSRFEKWLEHADLVERVLLELADVVQEEFGEVYKLKLESNISVALPNGNNLSILYPNYGLVFEDWPARKYCWLAVSLDEHNQMFLIRGYNNRRSVRINNQVSMANVYIGRAGTNAEGLAKKLISAYRQLLM